MQLLEIIYLHQPSQFCLVPEQPPVEEQQKQVLSLVLSFGHTFWLHVPLAASTNKKVTTISFGGKTTIEDMMMELQW